MIRFIIYGTNSDDYTICSSLCWYLYDGTYLDVIIYLLFCFIFEV